MHTSKTLAGTLIDVLEEIGVKQIFGLIGDSLNPIGDAVRHSKIDWIGVHHEEEAALPAAGEAALTGRLDVCCGTTGPGRTRAPMAEEAERQETGAEALSVGVDPAAMTLVTGGAKPRSGFSLALLSFAAGSIDAVGFLSLGNVFTSAMSGNAILLGLALGQGRISAATHSLAAFVGYVVGVGVATLPLKMPKHGIERALALECLFLAAFAGLRTVTRAASPIGAPPWSPRCCVCLRA